MEGTGWALCCTWQRRHSSPHKRLPAHAAPGICMEHTAGAIRARVSGLDTRLHPHALSAANISHTTLTTLSTLCKLTSCPLPYAPLAHTHTHISNPSHAPILQPHPLHPHHCSLSPHTLYFPTLLQHLSCPPEHVRPPHILCALCRPPTLNTYHADVICDASHPPEHVRPLYRPQEPFKHSGCSRVAPAHKLPYVAVIPHQVPAAHRGACTCQLPGGDQAAGRRGGGCLGLSCPKQAGKSLVCSGH